MATVSTQPQAQPEYHHPVKQTGGSVGEGPPVIFHDDS